MAVSIPPWLSVGPLDPVQFYSQGVAQGQRAAAERNQAQVAAMQAAERQAARVADDQRAEAQAQNSAAQFAASLALRKEENERAARAAALQYEALEGVRRDVSSGLPMEQAIFRNPGLFLDNPAAIGTTLRAMQAGQPSTPLTAEEVAQRVHDLPGGGRAMQTGPQSFSVLERPPKAVTPKEGELTQKERARLGVLNRQAAALQRQLAELEEDGDDDLPRYRQTAEDLAKIDADIAALTGMAPSTVPPPTSPPMTAPPAGTSSGKVRVLRPDGRRSWIPESYLQQLPPGYRLDPAGASGTF
jgi:multidrug efflux pump subunit AcrA (membrane-fusion protein)